LGSLWSSPWIRLDFTVGTLRNFWTNIAVHFRGTEEFLQAPSSDVCGQYTLFFALHRLQICLRIAKNGMMSLCVAYRQVVQKEKTRFSLKIHLL
jgi:hypothetical protein